MGFGHSHKKKNIRRRVRSVTKEAQHDLAHLEGAEHHEAHGHEFSAGRSSSLGARAAISASAQLASSAPGTSRMAIRGRRSSIPTTRGRVTCRPGIRIRRFLIQCGARAHGRSIARRSWARRVGRRKSIAVSNSDWKRRRSIKDRTISTFARGELPHFAGINTFCKTHYLEDVKKVGGFDAAVVGVPFDIGTTYRSGTRFGPQAIRRISALYGTYNYELGVDLRESLKWCDLGDVFTIANIEKGFDQISKAVAHVRSNNVFPIMLGGDHSIGYPGRARHRALHRRPGRHHSHRSSRRYAGDRHGRADAHLPVVSRDEHPERAAGKSRPARHRRLAGAAPRREGRPWPRHHGAHDRRHRDDGRRQGRRDRARRRLEQWREGRLPQLRCRLARRRFRSRAPAGRSPADSCRAKCCACCAWSRARACAGWKSSKSLRNTTWAIRPRLWARARSWTCSRRS